MGVETVSLIIAAFVNGSLGIAALMRNSRSRLCLSFALLAVVLFAHDASAVLESFASVGRLASPRVHILLAFFIGPSVLIFLRQIAPSFRTRVHRWLWGFLPILFLCLPFLWLPLYSRVARLLFVVSHLAFLYPAAVWMGIL